MAYFAGNRNAQSSIDTQEKHSGNRSVRIVFDGKSNTYFSGICHYIRVKPSTVYLFSAWVKTKALTSDQAEAMEMVIIMAVSRGDLEAA